MRHLLPRPTGYSINDLQSTAVSGAKLNTLNLFLVSCTDVQKYDAGNRAMYIFSTGTIQFVFYVLFYCYNDAMLRYQWNFSTFDSITRRVCKQL